MVFITRENKIKYIIKPFFVIVIIVGGLLAVQYSDTYFALSLLGILALIYTNHWEKKELIKYSKEKLKAKWGQEHIEKRNLESIRKLYDFTKHRGERSLDDITWRDLNMDSVFQKLDHTKSLPGMQSLYNILRRPLFDEIELEKRDESINLFSKEKHISQEIQYPLYLFGKKDIKELFLYFKEGMDLDTKYLLVYRILSFSPLLAFGVFFLNKEIALLLALISISVNAYIFKKNKNRIYQEVETFRFIARLIKTSKDIIKIDTASLNIGREDLEDLIKKTKTIYKNVSSLNTKEGERSELDLLLDYWNIITLRETIIFYKTVNLINDKKDDLFQIYKIIGEIDAYISIASYKDSLEYHTKPSLIKSHDSFFLQVEKLYHPLLEEPVPYSFKLDNKGALVTGSNASGKSTYLRTIGINTVFAQTFNTVLAKEYSSNYYNLLTSIGTTDSIEEGDSYFMAEAKSLKRIVDNLSDGVPVLCILDEIFRGTNTAERISAAREVLNYMIDRNTLVVAATHDLELTSIVSESFDNYHFKESIEENDISFDYLLRRGPATTRNALAILKYLGYPKIIYENANKGVEEYELKGSFN